MNIWKDESSYSQGTKERIPHVWRLNLGRIRVGVHRHIDYPKDVWLVSCRDLDVSQEPLKSKDIKEAQAEALELLRGRLHNMVSLFDIAVAEQSQKESGGE